MQSLPPTPAPPPNRIRLMLGGESFPPFLMSNVNLGIYSVDNTQHEFHYQTHAIICPKFEMHFTKHYIRYG
jgi:hypothetical protein